MCRGPLRASGIEDHTDAADARMSRTIVERLRGLPLRRKPGPTMVWCRSTVAPFVTFVPFAYWHDQLVSTARDQALVSATTAQATRQAPLSRGDVNAARQTLRQLAGTQSVEFVRVH